MLSDQPYERTFRRRDGANLRRAPSEIGYSRMKVGKSLVFAPPFRTFPKLKKAEEVERLHTTALESTANGVVITGVKGRYRMGKTSVCRK